MMDYYNEIDGYKAEWLRNLIAEHLIPRGEVDERSITEVDPHDLAGYEQCHFFAGIGGWPLALELAGWRGPVWTGSCPCQPLSSAGQRKGHVDERHLWPAFYHLIAFCGPATVFGEQVAGKDGREWLAGVRADLEHAGYACGAADLSAAGVGAPHRRQRLFWVAHAAGRTQQRFGRDGTGIRPEELSAGGYRAVGWLGDAQAPGLPLRGRLAEVDGSPTRKGSFQAGAVLDAGGLGFAKNERREELDLLLQSGQPRQAGVDAFWAGAAWLPCLDGKARRVEPGIHSLADGVPARVGRLRAYGDAIVPQVAAEFVRACADAI